MNLLCVLLIDLGLAALTIGGISTIEPLRFLLVATRPAGAVLAAAGLGMLTIGLLLPARAMRLSAPPMRLDELVPEYQFGERHDTRVHASAAATFRALRAVTAGEIRFFGLLTWMRSPHLPGRGRESILNAPADQPLLEVATRSGFFVAAEDPNRELVLGTQIAFDSAAAPGRGLAKAFMNFRIDEEPDGWVRLATQTRVFATGDDARRRFAVYWRIIYPGSAFIRRMWLRAIKLRAEAG